MAEMTSPDDQPPYLVQGSDEPVFRGELDVDNFFYCTSGCGKLLIDNYFEENYIGVGIKCVGCGEISWTPGLIPGEVFSSKIVTLGSQGAFLVKETVSMYSTVIVTCDKEIAREMQLTAPRKDVEPLNFSDAGVEELARKYDEISGGKLELQLKSVRSGQGNIKKFPMAWAFDYIKTNNLTSKFPSDDNETVTALMWLHMFQHVLGVWQHHPRFDVVARGLAVPNSFLHTSSQLIATAYMFEQGNRIGLSLENKHGEANPDLYIRMTGNDNIFLEVKAPEALQWGEGTSISVDAIDDAVRKCLKKSSGQINRSHHGVLIISSSYIGDKFSNILDEAIQKSLKSKGRDHKYLAAVIGMSPSFVSYQMDGEHGFRFAMNCQFTVTLNKYYCGENPISTDS